MEIEYMMRQITGFFSDVLLKGCAITILAVFVAQFARTQTHLKKDFRLNVSANVSYEYTGGADPKGFAFNVGADKFITKMFAVHAEYRHATALTKPNFAIAFTQKNINYFDAKVAIYPLNTLHSSRGRRLLGGVNLAVGPSAFFGTISTESSWISYTDSNLIEFDRQSRLNFIDISDFGFVVKVGYEIYVSKRIYAGARLDWSTYFNEDGYTSYGVVVGLKL